MVEISLICPGCAAEYRIPPDAIPDGGREVECTACGHIWFVPGAYQQTDRAKPPQPAPPLAEQAPRPTAEPATKPADGTPALLPAKRRLPESVLSILRDEVEHERRARMAEDELFGSPKPAPTGVTPTPIRPVENDWPATTIVTPQHPPKRLGRAGDAGFDLPESARPTTVPVAPHSVEINPTLPVAGAARAMVTTPQPAAAPVEAVQPSQPTVFDQQAPVASNSGYSVGFGLAAMFAFAGLALYLLAPGLADAGSFGAALNDYREWVDHGRQWLRATLGGLAN
ncbi:zinc-ribbon domain-containing protein [Paracoccus sp. Z330]|uniref:Zinc-ribbon domain-containing protein n=1 Tax=Paracoccus onchidii TaxID=3017813 RepID=A0ABT4ZBN6_9RHOB|nr:zinc-ribbon domain-containing protein [Paracoccus onchidii]MDB6176778.1 zinc-ribbon domain-containing protein [Paracoccus onchidii]